MPFTPWKLIKRKNKYSKSPFIKNRCEAHLLLDNIHTVGGSVNRTSFASVLHVCLLKYHYLLLVRYQVQWRQLMKAMQKRREYVVIVQCKHN